MASVFPLASSKSTCPLGPLRWGWLKGSGTFLGASRPHPLLWSVGRLSRETSRMVLGPRERPRGLQVWQL